MGVVSRDNIIDFCDELLGACEFEDYGPNGLQVPGSETVERVVTGVSAHRVLFERAAGADADLVLCHHGLFLHSQPRLIDERLKLRLKVLFDADISLAAYHLPLDAHAEVGNNALICSELGIERAEPFATVRGNTIGWVGRAEVAIGATELVARCRSLFGAEPLVFASGPAEIKKIGVVSGSGSATLAEAAARGVDALVTGEASEPVMAEAQEAGIHFLACGHYNTETFGIMRLGELVAERFDVAHTFIDVPNPV